MQDFCYHIHTSRCPHADQTITDEKTVETFLKLGLKSIAFTDHCPWKIFDYNGNTDHAMLYPEKEDYLNSVDRLKEKYKGQIEIKKGWEMEYFPEYKDEMDQMKKETELIVLGQHFCPLVNGKRMGFHAKGFTPNSEEQMLYAKSIENACKEGYPTIVAHPDLYLKNIRKFTSTEEKAARVILSAIEKYNIPVEINLCQITKKYLPQFSSLEIGYPNADFWNVASEYKLRVLYGFDYHGYVDASLFPRSIETANKIIGSSVINKLHFCTRGEVNE